MTSRPPAARTFSRSPSVISFASASACSAASAVGAGTAFSSCSSSSFAFARARGSSLTRASSAIVRTSISCSSVISGLKPRLRSRSSASTSGLPPSKMSVPRPAMFVAMVTAPTRPAWATMCASRSWFLAFSVSCLMPRLSSKRLRRSELSMDTVPTKHGWPLELRSAISSATALNLASIVRYTWSLRSLRITGLLGGMAVTSSL